MWFFVASLCAAYVFVGIALFCGACYTGNWILIALSIDGYVLNLFILEYAKGKDW